MILFKSARRKLFSFFCYLILYFLNEEPLSITSTLRESYIQLGPRYLEAPS